MKRANNKGGGNKKGMTEVKKLFFADENSLLKRQRLHQEISGLTNKFYKDYLRSWYTKEPPSSEIVEAKGHTDLGRDRES